MKREQVLPHVMADMAARIAKGADEYGEPLTTFNGRDALVDAYEEALDLALYLKQAIMERDARSACPSDPKRQHYAYAAPEGVIDLPCSACDHKPPEWPGPDWAQAPEWAEWWSYGKFDGEEWGVWHEGEPVLAVCGWSDSSGESRQSSTTFGYTGDVRDSLRKRPK